MASDIVPIQLSLTEGDLVTLWAPRWREDGEEWEAFLGNDDYLFAFPEVAQLAAFVRTDDAHDLGDHPAWPVVADLSVAELTPEDAHRYDVIGVPELAAEDTDQWTVGELAEIVGMVRSIDPGACAPGRVRTTRSGRLVEPDDAHRDVFEATAVEVAAELVGLDRGGQAVERSVGVDLACLWVHRQDDVAVALGELLRRSDQCRLFGSRVLGHRITSSSSSTASNDVPVSRCTGLTTRSGHLFAPDSHGPS